MISKKGMTVRVVSLILALVFLLFVLGLILPKSTDANESLHIAICKFAPWCKGDAQGNGPSGVFQKDPNLKDFGSAIDLIENLECLEKLEIDGLDVYYLRTKEEIPYHLLHIHNNKNFFVLMDGNKDYAKVVSDVLKEGEKSDMLVGLKIDAETFPDGGSTLYYEEKEDEFIPLGDLIYGTGEGFDYPHLSEKIKTVEKNCGD